MSKLDLRPSVTSRMFQMNSLHSSLIFKCAHISIIVFAVICFTLLKNAFRESRAFSYSCSFFSMSAKLSSSSSSYCY